jgi:hypothetical protein
MLGSGALSGPLFSYVGREQGVIKDIVDDALVGLDA